MVLVMIGEQQEITIEVINFGNPINLAAVKDDVIINVIWSDPDHAPPMEGVTYIPVPEGAWTGWRNIGGVWTAPLSPVPQRVTKAQAKIALLRAGLLSQVTAAIAQSPEAQIWFEDALYWERDNPYIAQFAQALSLSSEQVDALFELADTING